MTPKTITSFGTKDRVISLIDVAACKTPINRPTAKATVKIGPAVRTMFQKAKRRYPIFASNSISGAFHQGWANVATSDPMVIDHPSTSTNRSSLNGRDTSIGDNIIIPSDIRIDAITMSITKNGKNSKKPI